MTSFDFGFEMNELTGSLQPYALKLTRDSEDADDLVQETMMKAFVNKEKFAEGTNLKAWMYTIMKNTFITNYQRMLRRNTFIDTTENLHFLNSTSNTISNSAVGSFILNDIERAISSLDDIYRRPFLLHFQGYKYHEISEKLDIPIGTVKNRIHIARKELKTTLNIYSNSN